MLLGTVNEKQKQGEFGMWNEELCTLKLFLLSDPLYVEDKQESKRILYVT